MPKPRKKSGTRQLEKRLFIVCEGKKDHSESAYFKAFIKCCKFAGNKVKVAVVDTAKNTGKELVKEAKKLRELATIDEAWVVYDMDGYTKHPETFSLAKNSNIKIAFSAISFEFWILLHFEETSKAFMKSDDVIKYMKQKNYIDYSKKSQEIHRLTKDKILIAKKNAILINKRQQCGNPTGTPIYRLNPYTNIHMLIDTINDLQTIK